MKLKFASLFLLLFLTANSQTSFNSESYNITKSDLETNTFSKDSTANALVIYEYGNSYVDKASFNLKTEIKRKIKILNRKGFDQANVTIPLYNNDDGLKVDISKIVATTTNLKDGKVVKSTLLKDQIFREKKNNNITLVKFTLPNIKEGSVISYSYYLKSPFMYNYKGWNFQNEIPTLHSEYRASIPGNYEYNIKLVGAKKLFKNDSKLTKRCLDPGNGADADCFDSVYIMKDIPAFKKESYMTTKENYLSRIDYELKVFKGFDGSIKNYTKTWETADKDLKTEQSIGKQLKKGSLVKDLLPATIISESDALQKAKDIFVFVQENYVWNEEFNLFKEVSLKDLIKKKTGRASEINLLLFNLLKENNIDVKPVLISTRARGLATKVYPVISDFNYLILQATINNKTFLLDAVDDYLAFGQIPFRCLNQYGRLLDFKNGSSWIPIKASKTSTKIYKTELNIDDNSLLKGTIESKKTGYHALFSKKEYYKNKNDYLKTIQDEHSDVNISNHNVSTNDKNNFQFEETFDISIETETIGSTIYINPFIFKFFTENPFKLQERTYPIDFGYADTYIYSYKLNYDSNVYKIEDIPKSLAYKLPNKTGTIILNTNKNENNITIFFKFNFTEPIYTSNFYTYLKEYFNKIVEIQKNSLIVLKKNN